MGLAVANQDGYARLGVVLCRARFSADLARRTVRLVALVIYGLNTQVRLNARGAGTSPSASATSMPGSAPTSPTSAPF